MSLSSYHENKFLSPLPIEVVLGGEGFKDVVLSVGKFHGVVVGTEFASPQHPRSPPLVAHKVEHSKTIAMPSEEVLDALRKQRRLVYYFSRWFSQGVFKVFVEPQFGEDFKVLLKQAIQERISGEISLVDEPVNKPDVVDRPILRRWGDTGVDIVWSTMHDGPWGGFEIHALDMEERAAKCALALAHFCRFNQIRDMKHSVPLGAKYFNLTLESPSEEVLNGAVIPAGTAIELRFQNLHSDVLRFRCVSLNASLGVHQIYPPDRGYAMGVRGGETLTVSIPEMEEGRGRVRHTIRVVVSRHTSTIYPSLRYLELPDIGGAVPDSVRAEFIRGEHTGLSPGDMYNFPWWSRDLEFWIEPASSEGQEQEEETTTT